MSDKQISENSDQPTAGVQPTSFGRRKAQVADTLNCRADDADESRETAAPTANAVLPRTDDEQVKIKQLAQLAAGVGEEASSEADADTMSGTSTGSARIEELAELAAGVGAAEKLSRRQGAADSGVIVTTTNSVEGYRISEYLGLVNGEAILGANLFKDMFASITDVVGGRSGSYERELTKARGIAVQDMIDSAMFRDADAIVGVDIDYEVLSMRGSMLMVMASGTAVKLIPND